MNKELRKIIHEAISELENQDKPQVPPLPAEHMMAIKRIQAYAHWGMYNAKTSPQRLVEVVQRIAKEVDALVKSMTFPKKMEEKSPPGWSGTVKAMKKHKDIDNPLSIIPTIPAKLLLVILPMVAELGITEIVPSTLAATKSGFPSPFKSPKNMLPSWLSG